MSITMSNNERGEVVRPSWILLGPCTIRLGEMPSPRRVYVCVCGGGGVLRTTYNLRGVGEVRLICEAHVTHQKL